MPKTARTDYRTHIMILGWINIVFSAMFGCFGIFAMIFLSGIGIASEDPQAARILGFIGFAAALFFITLALPGFFAGYGLLKRRNWGRILAIVVGALNLFNIPIGTALGIYTLWVLTLDDATEYFKGKPLG